MSSLIENTIPKGRLVTIDALRGIAALSIAVAHVSGNVVMTFQQMGDSLLNVLFFHLRLELQEFIYSSLFQDSAYICVGAKQKLTPKKTQKKR